MLKLVSHTDIQNSITQKKVQNCITHTNVQTSITQTNVERVSHKDKMQSCPSSKYFLCLNLQTVKKIILLMFQIDKILTFPTVGGKRDR